MKPKKQSKKPREWYATYDEDGRLKLLFLYPTMSDARTCAAIWEEVIKVREVLPKRRK